MSKKSDKTPPRKVPDRDQYYMGQAFLIMAKSKDPATQNGAIIVSQDNCPIGTGYNGPPASYDDDDLDWSRPNKYPHMVHAEHNAIDHCQLPLLLPGSTIYVTARPCKVCMLYIVNKGIKKVIFFPRACDSGSSINQDADIVDDIVKKTKGKVELVEFKGNLNWMRDHMLLLEDLGIF